MVKSGKLSLPNIDETKKELQKINTMLKNERIVIENAKSGLTKREISILDHIPSQKL